jgi:hypothetical protein
MVLLPMDFESIASASSAIPALNQRGGFITLIP